MDVGGPYTLELVFLATGVLLGLTVLAGTVSSRFGFPAVLGFLALGMLAGSDGPGGIAFEITRWPRRPASHA